MSYSSKCEGSMYLYENATATVIDTVDQYHAVQGFLQGTINVGTTYTASDSGSISLTQNNGGILRCTDGTHGLTTGQYITLTGMGDAAHVGRTRVTVIDVDVFDCDDIAWNSNGDTGNWQRGACLTINPGYGGRFLINFSSSFTSAGNNKNYKVEMSKNADALDEFVAERKVGVAGDLGNTSAGGMVNLESGDCVYMTVEGTSDATNLTFVHLNVHINRV
jgi:hypothetical protein